MLLRRGVGPRPGNLVFDAYVVHLHDVEMVNLQRLLQSVLRTQHHLCGDILQLHWNATSKEARVSQMCAQVGLNVMLVMLIYVS